MAADRNANHCLIVIGGSAGSLEALRFMVSRIPEDVPAALAIVQHITPDAASLLPQILENSGNLPCKVAANGEMIQPGYIYVAPPNQHLMVEHSLFRLSNGPRENRTRPAIDPLFRSAAISYRSRAIGVVLSGLLDDGSSGLAAIKRCGGLAIVQDPADSLYPQMPLNAIQATQVDFCPSSQEIGLLLTRLAIERATMTDSITVPRDLAMEVNVALRAISDTALQESLGTRAPMSCPDCDGPLWRVHDNIRRYRCQVGHAHTANSLLASQAGAIENALWMAVRTLEEQANLLDRMARDADERGSDKISDRYKLRSEEARTSAHAIRDSIMQMPTIEHPASSDPDLDYLAPTTP